MAKVVGPLLSERATGLAGQTLYLPSRSGTNAGKRSCDHVGNSGPSVNARARWKSGLKAWSELSAADRATWADPAGGEAKAFALYTGCAARLLSIGQAVPGAYSSIGPQPRPYFAGFFSTYESPVSYDVSIAYDAPCALIARVTAAMSFLRRSSCSPKKLAQVGYGLVADNWIRCTLPCAAPIGFYRVDYLDPLSGEIIFQDAGSWDAWDYVPQMARILR